MLSPEMSVISFKINIFKPIQQLRMFIVNVNRIVLKTFANNLRGNIFETKILFKLSYRKVGPDNLCQLRLV